MARVDQELPKFFGTPLVVGRWRGIESAWKLYEMIGSKRKGRGEKKVYRLVARLFSADYFREEEGHPDLDSSFGKDGAVQNNAQKACSLRPYSTIVVLSIWVVCSWIEGFTKNGGWLYTP